MATDDHGVTSPTGADSELSADFKSKMKTNTSAASAATGNDVDDPEEEAKRLARQQHRESRVGDEVPAIDSATEGVFSQLLLESILEQKSVSDFVGGLPDKRGTLLVRFPTTVLSKNWKKRYFTLHGDALYFHEDQSVIHPSIGAGGSMSASLDKSATEGVNYSKCKKIDIANFWIIQNEGAAGGAAAAAMAAATVAAANAESNKKERGKLGTAEDELHNPDGDEPTTSSTDKDKDRESLPAGAAAAMKERRPSKFDEMFAKNKKNSSSKDKDKSKDADEDEKKEDKLGDKDDKKKTDADRDYEIAAAAAAAAAAANAGGNKDKDSKSSSSSFSSSSSSSSDRKDAKKKEDPGVVVRGRRRSSLVNERGSTVILLIPRSKSAGALGTSSMPDAVELTGLNEGSMADLATLSEWTQAINARIALINFLHSPMNLKSMTRGGRELLAFLTTDPPTSVAVGAGAGASSRLVIRNKFTDLTPVLRHFKEALSHRRVIEIVFSNVALTDEALEALAELIEEGGSHTGGANSGSHTTTTITTAPTYLSVPLLDLSRNLITAQGMRALHRAIKANTHIGKIILDNNQIGDRGIAALVYGKESAAGEEGATATPDASATPSSTPSSSSSTCWTPGMSLSTLSLAHNQLSDRGLAALLRSCGPAAAADADDDDDDEVASPLTSLTSLNLSQNQLTDDGAKVLVDFLRRHPAIRQLNLAGNFLGDGAARALGELLSSSGSSAIEELDLRDNTISSEGVSALLEGLEKRAVKSKVTMDLSGNPGLDVRTLNKLATSFQVALSEEQQRAAGGSNSSVWGVHVTSLAFTVYDPEVMTARGAGRAAGPAPSPRLSPSSASQSPPVASISTSQQNVLNLFSPNLSSNGGASSSDLPQWGAMTSGQPPAHPQHAAKVVPASSGTTGSASSSRPGSAVSTPSSSAKKKERKRASINDPTAPKIAIAAQPVRSAAQGKLAIQPLQPPPEFSQPMGSPDGGPPDAAMATTPAHPSAGAATPSSTATPGASALPTTHAQATPVVEDDEDDPNALLPGTGGLRTAKGMSNA